MTLGEDGSVSLQAHLSALFSAREERVDKQFEDIKDLLRRQNGEIGTNSDGVHENAKAIASLKTWVALAGGGMGILGIAAIVLQALT